MVLNLLKLEICCRKTSKYIGTTIFCSLVLVIGLGFWCRTDAFDSTLYCYSDPAAKKPSKCAGKHQTLDENTHCFGDYSTKTNF